jgi:hypothetical protein
LRWNCGVALRHRRNGVSQRLASACARRQNFCCIDAHHGRRRCVRGDREAPANNIGGGILTVYLIGTAWLTARRRNGETSPFDWVWLLIPLAIGVLGWKNGIDAMHSPRGEKYGVPAGMHLFMGTVCLLAAAGDVRMLLRGEVRGAQRVARHLWRMCFGLFIAAGSSFMGPSNRPRRLLSSMGIAQHLPAGLFSINVYVVLTILPLILLVFWLVRVRFTKTYRKNSASPPGEVYPLTS